MKDGFTVFPLYILHKTLCYIPPWTQRPWVGQIGTERAPQCSHFVQWMMRATKRKWWERGSDSPLKSKYNITQWKKSWIQTLIAENWATTFVPIRKNRVIVQSDCWLVCWRKWLSPQARSQPAFTSPSYPILELCFSHSPAVAVLCNRTVNVLELLDIWRKSASSHLVSTQK